MPISAVILNLALYPSTPTVPPAWSGSAPEVNGRIETAFLLLARSYTSTGAEMEWQTMWGIVESCDGSIVYTIEGNANNACKQLSYAVGDRRILGYGTLSK